MTVVVEFNRLGGGDQTRCAPGDPETGVAALRGAGFAPTRAAQEAGYFVCRIDGKPADDPCQRASPEDAYWSYWHAEPGGTWTFSNAGAGTYDPEPGTVEGWSFGGGEPPSTPPPDRRAAEPSRAPAAAPSRTPEPAPASPAPRRSPSAAAAPATAAPEAEATPSPRTAPTPSSAASPAPAGTRPATPSPTPGRVLTVDDPVAPEESGSPLVGVLLAAAVVLGLGAAAAFRARRR